MFEFVSIIGSLILLYVCKVFVVLEFKGVLYWIDFIVLFVGNDVFVWFSLLWCILVLIEGDMVFNDFSVICQYFEDCYLMFVLYLVDFVDCVCVCWLEEYVDMYLGDVLIWWLFFQFGVRCFLFCEEVDEVMVCKVCEEEIFVVLDYFEV